TPMTRLASPRLLLFPLAAVIAAAALVGSAPRAVVAAVGDCTPGADWGTSRPNLAADVLTLVNAHRQQIGLSALSQASTLTNAATWKARHMARYGYMAHDDPAPPVARTVGDRLAACGYPVGAASWG